MTYFWLSDAPDPPSFLRASFSLLTGLAASAGMAALAVPAARKMVYPPYEETKLRDHVLWDRVLDDGVSVRCTDGSLFQVIAVDGVDLSARAPEGQEELNRRRRQWLESLGELKSGPVRVLTMRSVYDHSGDPEAYRQELLRTVQTQWHNTFSKSFKNRHFIMVSVPPGTERARETLSEMSKNAVEKLQDFRARVLELGKRGERSPLLSFLGELLNPGREVVIGAHSGAPVERAADGSLHYGALDKRLADRLVASQILFHDGWASKREDGIAVFRDGSEEVWMAGVGVGAWGDFSSADILSHVMSVEAEMTVSHSIEVYDSAKATLILEDLGRKSFNAQISRKWGMSSRALDHISAALQAVSTRGGQQLCVHQMMVFVYGRSREDLEYRVGLVRRALETFRIKPVQARDDCEVMWFSMLPPHFEWVRDTRMMSGNVAHFVSFDTPARGMDRCDWGPRPVNVFRTSQGTPYAFCWHRSPGPLETGHTVIIGGTGAGKTVLANFLAISSLGYENSRVFLLDRSDGSYVCTKAFGGAYLHLQTGVDEVGQTCELNPLQQDLGVHGSWVTNWMRDFVTGTNDRESEKHLVRVIDRMAALPPAKRSLDDILSAIPDNVPIHHELKRWCAGGKYAYLFNAARDTLSFGEERLVTFDFTHILSDLVATRALLPYLSYRIETEMQRVGAPWLMVIDETAPLLKDPTFRDWYFKLLQESRKMRGVVVSCFQRVGTLREAGVTELVMGQCPTMVILPNETASASDYIDGLGLTDAEFSIVNRSHPIAQQLNRYALVKREGEGSIVLDVDLAPIGAKSLSLFQSGAGPANRLRAFEREEGNVERAVRRYMGYEAMKIAA